MTVFSIKLLAMVSMIVDHLGYWLYTQGLISFQLCHGLRAFGRLAFPLFCFLIVNGCMHSSDRKKYITRLTLFAVISQIPFTMVFSESSGTMPLVFKTPSLIFIFLALFLGFLWYRFVRADITAVLPVLALLMGLSTLSIGNVYLLRSDMNVFYTLALALAMVCALDNFINPEAESPEKYALVVAVLIALLLIRDKADYGINGLLLILILWFFRAGRRQQLIMLLIWCALQYTPLPGNFAYFLCAAASLLPVALYNGKLGKPMKTAFYLVYPLHLSVLALLGI